MTAAKKKRTPEEIKLILAAAEAATPTGTKIRHIGTRNVYVVQGFAFASSAVGRAGFSVLVLYRADDGPLFCRSTVGFCDGFEDA